MEIFIPNILSWFDLPVKKEFYIKCKNGKGIFGNVDLVFRMLALYFDFSQKVMEEPCVGVVPLFHSL
jgi:hypothetical protein